MSANIIYPPYMCKVRDFAYLTTPVTSAVKAAVNK